MAKDRGEVFRGNGRPKGKNGIGNEDTKLLLPYVSVERWLRELRPATKFHCLRSMVTLTRATGMDPDKFLEWAKSKDSLEVQDLIDRMANDLKPASKVSLKGDIRSFLRHNGYNNLPKTRLRYTPTDWHRGYKKEEIRKLIGFLDNNHHKLFAYIAVESGLRAQMILEIRYRHIKEDYEKGIVPVGIRFEPEFYDRTKSAGFTFLGQRSIALLKEYLGGKVPKPDDKLIPFKYIGIYSALTRAKVKANLDPKIQPLHGFRKYFENALDNADIDHEKKMVIEGHFAGTRARTYTSREWDELRPLYRKAYSEIDPDTAPNPQLEEKLETSAENVRKLENTIKALQTEVTDLRKEREEGFETRWRRVEAAIEKKADRLDNLNLEPSREYWQETKRIADKAEMTVDELVALLATRVIEEEKAKKKESDKRSTG